MSYSCLCIAAALLISSASLASPATAGEAPIRNVVITETPIGNVPAGKYAFKASVSSVEPGAETPSTSTSTQGFATCWKGR